MDKINEFVQKLTEAQKTKLIEHFDKIYECTELSDHEHKIIYLAYLWKNGLVYTEESGASWFDNKQAGVSIEDYEITIENEDSGGINLNLMYDYYDMNNLISIL